MSSTLTNLSAIHDPFSERSADRVEDLAPVDLHGVGSGEQPGEGDLENVAARPGVNVGVGPCGADQRDEAEEQDELSR